MLRLTRYELKKLCLKRALLLAVLVFGILNFMKIQDLYQSYSYLLNDGSKESWNTVYWELYPQFSGEITTEKIDSLMAMYRPLEQMTSDLTASTATDREDTMTGNLYSDRNLLDKYYVRPMKYFLGYRDTAVQVAQQSRENSTFFASVNNDFEARKNAMVYHLFADREISDFAYGEMYNYYVNYDFSTVLMLLLCLYGITTVFVREKETQMDLLLMTSSNGGLKTYGAKVIAVSIFIVCIVFLFSLLDFIGFVTAFHTVEGGNLPVYAISNFETASINVSLFQYSLLSAAVKALGLWALGMLMLLLSMFWRTALIPFVLNFSLALGLILLAAGSAFYSNTWEKVWNPCALLMNRMLFAKTEFVNLLGYPFLSYQAAILFSSTIGIIAVAVMIIFVRSASNQHCKSGGVYA